MTAKLSPEMLPSLLDYPIQPPPAGVTPDFIDPDTISYQVYITAGVYIPLMLGFSVIRFASRLYIRVETYIADDGSSSFYDLGRPLKLE